MHPRFVPATLATLGAALSLGGCLVELPEHGADGPLVVLVTPDDDGPAFADGAARFSLELRGDSATRTFRGEVELTVSGGAFIGGGAELSTRMPPSGVFTAELIAGRHPGPLLVEARFDGFVARSPTIDLAPRAPDALALFVADGTLAPGESTELRITLAADPPTAAPSWGSAVALAACCDDGGDPGPCPAGEAPLHLPPRAMLAEGEDAIRVEVTAADGPAALAVVVAHVVASIDGAPPACGPGPSARIAVAGQ